VVYEVEGSKPRGRLKRTWREVVQNTQIEGEDAIDHSGGS